MTIRTKALDRCVAHGEPYTYIYICILYIYAYREQPAVGRREEEHGALVHREEAARVAWEIPRRTIRTRGCAHHTH